MNTKKESKTPYLILFIIVIFAIGIYFYLKGSEVDSGLTLEQVNVENQAIGVKVLSTLNMLKSLKIDGEIFNTPVYKTLVDYSVGIPPLPVGRPNPFAPVPGLTLPSTNNRSSRNRSKKYVDIIYNFTQIVN